VNSLRLPLPLLILVGLVLMLVFLRLGQKMHHPSLDQAVERIVYGTQDQAERSALVELVKDHAAEGAASDRRKARFLATAAVLLGDRSALLLAREALGGSTFAWRQEELGSIEKLSLGEPAIDALIRGMVAEADGDRMGAQAHYGRAEVAGRMWALPLAVELAREGLGRLE